MTSVNWKIPKSLFGQLCTYLMSCNIHHWTWLIFTQRIFQPSFQMIWKMFLDLWCRQAWSYGQMDRWMDTGNNKTSSALGLRGKNGRARNSQLPGSQCYEKWRRATVCIIYYNMTVWILAGNYISFAIAAGLIRLHMADVKKSRV